MFRDLVPFDLVVTLFTRYRVGGVLDSRLFLEIILIIVSITLEIILIVTIKLGIILIVILIIVYNELALDHLQLVTLATIRGELCESVKNHCFCSKSREVH